MTISISPKIEELLVKRAKQEGSDVNAVADTLLSEALLADEIDREITLEGLRRGLADVAAGRVRPYDDYAAELRAKYSLPVHLSNDELVCET